MTNGALRPFFECRGRMHTYRLENETEDSTISFSASDDGAAIETASRRLKPGDFYTLRRMPNGGDGGYLVAEGPDRPRADDLGIPKVMQTYRLEYPDGTVTRFAAKNDDDARRKVPKLARKSGYRLLCGPTHSKLGRPVPLQEPTTSL